VNTKVAEMFLTAFTTPSRVWHVPALRHSTAFQQS